MSFSFHPEAEEEFNKAIDYYEELEPGFGYDFALEVSAAIKSLRGEIMLKIHDFALPA